MIEDAMHSITLIEPQLCQAFVAQLSLRSEVMDRVVKAQRDDPQLQTMIGKANITLDDEGVIRFQHITCVPDVVEVKKEVLEEAHRSKFSIHPGSSKMYQDLKRNFW